MFNLKTKLVSFYLTLLRQFIARFLSLNDRILRALINIYIDKFAKRSQSRVLTSDEQLAEMKESATLTGAIQNFYSLLTSVTQLFCDKTVDLIAVYNIKTMSIRQFAKVNTVLQEAIKIFTIDLKSHEKLICTSHFDDEKLRVKLLQLPAVFNSKSTLNQMEDLKLGYERGS